MTEALYRSSAPVFKVDGQPAGELARDLCWLEIAEDTGGLRTCVARFVAVGPRPGQRDEGLLYLDGQLVDFGKRLEVALGPRDDARVVFQGTVSAIEARFEEGRTPEVVLFAEDGLMKLRMTRRSRTYERKSDADIARDVAQEHGFAADVDAAGPTFDVVQQWNQSDLAFLRARARLVQAELWMEDDKLCFKSRPARTATSLTLVAGNQLLSARIRADLAHQRTKVKVSGYDASARDLVDGSADGDAVKAEVEEGRTGPDVLAHALGDRVSLRTREAPLTRDEADAWARAEMLRRARRFVHVEGVTSGSPDLVVGSKLELQGVGAPFSGGGYTVTRMRHTYDLERGHRTRFEAERPTVNARGSES